MKEKENAEEEENWACSHIISKYELSQSAGKSERERNEGVEEWDWAKNRNANGQRTNKNIENKSQRKTHWNKNI